MIRDILFGYLFGVGFYTAVVTFGIAAAILEDVFTKGEKTK